MKAFLEVDVDDVLEVAAFIERLRAKHSRVADIEGSGAPEFVDGQGHWTEAEIRVLCERLVDRGTAQAATVTLLDRCASEPGAWVNKSVIDAEFPGRALQGQLSGLTRMLKSKHLLGTYRDYWPMEWRREFLKDGASYQYRMPAPVAAWWVTARNAGK